MYVGRTSSNLFVGMNMILMRAVESVSMQLSVPTATALPNVF